MSEREIKKRVKEITTKIKKRRLRAITLQGAIEKRSKKIIRQIKKRRLRAISLQRAIKKSPIS